MSLGPPAAAAVCVAVLASMPALAPVASDSTALVCRPPAAPDPTRAVPDEATVGAAATDPAVAPTAALVAVGPPIQFWVCVRVILGQLSLFKRAHSIEMSIDCHG